MSPQRCTSCAARPRDRDARFCSACGALLSQPAAVLADRDGGGCAESERPRGAAARGRHRWGPAGLAAVVLIAVAAGIGAMLEPSDTTADPHVDLPDAAEVEQRVVDRVAAVRAPRGGCSPQGCAAWTATAGFGPVLVHAGRVFHLDAGELVVWDAGTGEQLTRTRSLVAAPVMQPQLTPIEHPAGALVVAAAGVGGGLEVWRADDLELAWRLPDAGDGRGAGRLLQATAASIVTVRPRLDVDGDARGVEVVGHDPVSGEERWSAAGSPTGADGLIVLRPEDGVGKEQLLDPATGEQVLVAPVGSYAGSSTDRVAVDRGRAVEVLSWPGSERVAKLAARGDEQVRFVGGLLTRGPSGWAATPEDWLGTIEVESGLTTEVIDPAHGRTLASFDERPAVVAAGPDGNGAIVVEEHGAVTSVSHVTSSFEQRWRSLVPWGAQRVLRVRTGAPGLVIVDTVGADGAVVYWRFDVRTGLPVAEGGFGATAPNPRGTGSFDGLSVRWEPDQTVVVGAAGLVRFASDVEVLHPGEPLLVRDGDRLIAVDEVRTRSG